MNKLDLRATIIGDHLGELESNLQLNSWSTHRLSAEEVRNLKPEKIAAFQPFAWSKVLIIEAGLWNDGIRSKIAAAIRIPIVVATPQDGKFDSQKLLHEIMQKVKNS